MDIIDVGLIASYILVVLCALAAVLIPLLQSLGDPKSLAKSGIGLGAVVLIFVIGYAIADPNSPNTTEGTSKMVGAGLITWYVLSIIAIGGIIYTEVSKMIK